MQEKTKPIRKNFFTAILFFCAVPLFQSVSADRQNPLLTPTAIIISQEGVHRFDRHSLAPEWQALENIQTYQPVMGKKLLYVGSTQGLFALDPKNGDIVWHIETDKTLFSPTVSGRLYAGSLHGELYAINPEDGSIAWRRQLEGWTYSPAVTADKKQIWTAGQSHAATYFDYNGRLLGTVQLGQEAIFSPHLIDDSHIAINLFNGHSAVIDSTNGKISAQLPGSSQPNHLSLDGNTIYRSNRDGSLSAFNKRTYQTKWQINFVSSNLSLHPAIPGYLLMSDLDRRLVLVDLSNNKVVYQARLPGQLLSPVQVQADVIVYFTKDRLQPNHLQAVKLAAGST